MDSVICVVIGAVVGFFIGFIACCFCKMDD